MNKVLNLKQIYLYILETLYNSYSYQKVDFNVSLNPIFFSYSFHASLGIGENSRYNVRRITERDVNVMTTYHFNVYVT